MRTGSTRAFPYPVLTAHKSEGADYVDCSLDCNLKGKVDGGDEFKLNYEFKLNLDTKGSGLEIRALMEEHLAAYALEIQCPITYFREMRVLDHDKGTLAVRASDLYGKVKVIPMMVMTEDVNNFCSEAHNSEYGGQKFNLKRGDMIAQSNSLSWDVKPDSGSLVNVRVNETLKDSIYEIHPEQEYLYIDVSSELKRVWDISSPNRQLNVSLMMAAYKDCVLFALKEIAVNDYECIKNQPWLHSFYKTLDRHGINIKSIKKDEDFNKLNVIAQKLLIKIKLKKIFDEIISKDEHAAE